MLSRSLLVGLLCAVVPAGAVVARSQPDAAPLRLLVVTGGHDYPTSFYTLFEQPGLVWDHETTSESAYRRDLRSRYDVLVLYDMPATLSAAGRANLQAFAESGKGIVVLHHALCSHNDWDWYRDLIGARYQVEAQPGRPASSYKHDETIPIVVAHPHPITRGVALTEIYDETYKGMWISPQNTVLLTTTHPLADPPLAWISGYARSRVVAIQPGHGREAHVHPATARSSSTPSRGRADGCSDSLGRRHAGGHPQKDDGARRVGQSPEPQVRLHEPLDERRGEAVRMEVLLDRPLDRRR